MSNITPKQENLPASKLSEWDDGSQYLGQDVLLSKILPMQGQSVLVTDMKAQVGEFRDSVTGALMGSIINPIEIIPFHLEKFWDIQKEKANERGEKQFKYERSELLIENPMQEGYNDNLPWQDTEDGTPIKRIRRMNFYVMLPSEVAAGTSVPYIFSFKSTSYREGKKVFTQMYMRNKRAGLPPPAYVFKVGGIKAKNEAGQTYIVPTVELGRRSTDQEIQECLSWYKTIKGKNPNVTVKVDDSDLMGSVESFNEGEIAGTGEF